MAEQVVTLLRAQHARIEELFTEVLGSDGDTRQERFDELVRLLAVHETAEEEVVHPRSRSSTATGEGVIDARLAEEREAKELLARLSELGADHPDFPAQLRTLRGAVLAHATREERYEFPYLESELDPPTLERLAAAVLAAERFAPTRPHPGVESAAGNLLAGPPMAVVDRVRDAVRNAMR